MATAAAMAALRAMALGDCGGSSSDDNRCRDSRGKDDGNGGNSVGDDSPCCSCHCPLCHPPHHCQCHCLCCHHCHRICQCATKRAMARAARGVGTATKRAMVRAARVMAMATR
jgi:hypothetical protein